MGDRMSRFGLGNLSEGWRGSARLLAALLVPAAIVSWMLISGANQRKVLEERNMRWLGYMANQIERRISNFDEAMKRWAYGGSDKSAANSQRTPSRSSPANRFGAVENLDTEDCTTVGNNIGNFGVAREAGKLMLHFRRTKSGEVDACAASDLGLIVEQSIRQGVFLSVVLAEREGRVLYQTDQTQLKFTNISFLFTPTSTEATAASSAAKSPAPPPGANAPTSSTHSIRPIGDTQYSVYVQPVRLRVSDGAGPGDWLLIGISSADTPWQSTGPQGLLFLLPLVVLLVALSWPLPRVWLMPPTAPLRPRFLAITAACSLAIVLILTVLGLYFFIRNFSVVRTDERLELLSEEIGSNLAHELTLAIKQLDILDRRAYDKRIEALEGDPSEVGLLRQLQPGEIVFPFEYADWINAQGQKDFRWTTSKEPARPINVSDRQYFKDVVENRLLPKLAEETPPFAIERVLSRTTGKMLTMLAIRSRLKDELLAEQRLPVANLGVILPSLERPVLPAEFGFAVIDSTGTVLFHSEPSRRWSGRRSLLGFSVDADGLRQVRRAQHGGEPFFRVPGGSRIGPSG